MNCGMVEEVKRSTLMWFGHLERMRREELTKRMYKSGVDTAGVREKRGDRKLRGMVNAIVKFMDWSKCRRLS